MPAFVTRRRFYNCQEEEEEEEEKEKGGGGQLKAREPLTINDGQLRRPHYVN